MLEDYMRWLVERCSRRRDNAPTHERRRLYEERVTILYGLISAMRVPIDALRRGALRTIATMNDISDDEDSPLYAAIHAPASLSDAQHALNVIRAMEQGSSSGAVMSTNVDMVANALGRGGAYPPTDGSSSEVDETASEIKRRYTQSGQDEVSDPELWFLLNYGGSDSESMEDWSSFGMFKWSQQNFIWTGISWDSAEAWG